jgi:poly(3-hydroxybutyrate) depolymerase
MYVSFRHNNVLRSFKVFVPPSANRGTKMVVSLHGAMGTGAGQEAGTGFSKLGAKEGFIALYPQSSGQGAHAAWKVTPTHLMLTLLDLWSNFFTHAVAHPQRNFRERFSMVLCSLPG